MSSDLAVETPIQPMASAFPDAGPLMRLAYRELDIAATGTKEQIKALGDPRLLPRPWDPATCRKPELREEVWAWLEEVVSWLNHEYVWDVGGVIPSCWPQHPHLVHEIAVLADQRRRAVIALTSDALEEWHRYCLPAFVDRAKHRVQDHCEQGHQTWPARSRYVRHTGETSRRGRADAFSRDVESTIRRIREGQPSQPRLGVVDLDTGEISDGPQ